MPIYPSLEFEAKTSICCGNGKHNPAYGSAISNKTIAQPFKGATSAKIMILGESSYIPQYQRISLDVGDRNNNQMGVDWQMQEIQT
jgi:hypothetical protein